MRCPLTFAQFFRQQRLDPGLAGEVFRYPARFDGAHDPRDVSPAAIPRATIVPPFNGKSGGVQSSREAGEAPVSNSRSRAHPIPS